MRFGSFYHILCKPFGSRKCELTCGRNMVKMAVHKGSLQVHRRRSGARNGSRRTVAAAIRNCYPGFALHSRLSNTYLVGNSCTAQTKSFDFNNSWDRRKHMEVESVECRSVWQVRTGCKSCSPPLIIGLSKCSALPAAIPGLKFTWQSVFQWLGIHGNASCLKPGLLWHGMRAKVGCKEAPAQDQSIRLTRANYPGQETRAQSNWHLSLGITKAWRTMQLRMGSQESSHLERTLPRIFSNEVSFNAVLNNTKRSQ